MTAHRSRVASGLLAGALAVGSIPSSEALAEENAADPPPSDSPWSSHGAPTLPQGRWEIALFGLGRYGLAEGIELDVQPFAFFVLPHAGMKLRLLERGPWSVSLAPRISYPSPFLSLISREGAGGLLPATTDVPFAILLEAEAIGSYRLGREHLASARFGLAVGPHASSDELPLLDFPFLYPRFAPLYSTVVPRLAVGLEGHVAAGCFYALDATGYLLFLDEVDGGYALEPSAELEYRFGERVALDAGLRTSIARYPVGTRFHYLPYLDVKIGF